ncbi:hypothetical protein PS663_02820 [Pseudomonas fluorescens]|nr:hypothetical protein PS663_02820 [Pseudomonas fluorescens]
MMGVTVKASSQASLRPFWECIPPVGAGLARDEASRVNTESVPDQFLLHRLLIHVD